MDEIINEFISLSNEQNEKIINIILNNLELTENTCEYNKKNIIKNLKELEILSDRCIKLIIEKPLPIEIVNKIKNTNNNVTWQWHDKYSANIPNFGKARWVTYYSWYTFISGYWAWDLDSTMSDAVCFIANKAEDAEAIFEAIASVLEEIGFLLELGIAIGIGSLGDIGYQIEDVNYNKNGSYIKMTFFVATGCRESSYDWNRFLDK